jgi:hypothetical protein
MLAGHDGRPHACSMFAVSEEDAAAIRAAFDEAGEVSAAVELRRRFPGLTDNAKAREWARTIAGWKPLQAMPRPARRFSSKDGTEVSPIKREGGGQA